MGNKNKIHLIMPMGGGGTRFSKNGFEAPKPLLLIQDKPFFYWATESVRKFVEIKDLTFVVLQEHIDRFEIDQRIREFYPEAVIHVLDHVLDGAVLTCLEGVKGIEDDLPVLFNDCDHIFTCQEFYDYCNAGKFEDMDGALLTFPSDDPKFSFLQLDEQGNVIRTVEKEVVSNQAICGAYYVRNRALFEQAAKQYLKECTYQEFFVSGVYNVMANDKKIIRSFVVDMHLPFGTPDEYDLALNSKEFEVFMS